MSRKIAQTNSKIPQEISLASSPPITRHNHARDGCYREVDSILDQVRPCPWPRDHHGQCAAPGQLFFANPVLLVGDPKKPVSPLHRRIHG